MQRWQDRDADMERAAEPVVLDAGLGDDSISTRLPTIREDSQEDGESQEALEAWLAEELTDNPVHPEEVDLMMASLVYRRPYHDRGSEQPIVERLNYASAGLDVDSVDYAGAHGVRDDGDRILEFDVTHEFSKVFKGGRTTTLEEHVCIVYNIDKKTTGVKLVKQTGSLLTPRN